jgi:hypothetical protein
LYFLGPQQTQLGLTDARQTEVGLKQDIFGRGEFTFAAYHIVKNNLFVPDPANPTNAVRSASNRREASRRRLDTGSTSSGSSTPTRRSCTRGSTSLPREIQQSPAQETFRSLFRNT